MGTTEVSSSLFGIAGFGFVGQAVYGSVTNPNAFYVYDKYQGMGDIGVLFRKSMIFCCLPTVQNEDGTQDFTEYGRFLTDCINSDYKGVLVIKSTVLYNNIRPFLGKLNIVFNPEFLCQNDAINDFLNQKVIILGGRIDKTRKVQEVYRDNFMLKDPDYEFCTIEEAINIKYVHNIYHAYKVLFWHYVEEKTGNARKMSDLYHKITDRNELSRICADGKKGYGGACFPKDVNAYNSVKPDDLTEFMRKYNLGLRGDEI